MIKKNRKIILVFGLVLATLLMSTPMLEPICKGENEELPFEGKLEVGDMLFMDMGSFNGNYDFFVGDHNDHVIICVDNSDPYNPLFIEAIGGDEYNGGVQELTYNELMNVRTYENFLIARVKGIQQWQTALVVEWLNDQLGEPYQPWGDFSWTVKKNETCYGDEESIGFVCSELVWAAYYNLEPRIDIDNNEWTSWPFPVPNVNMGLREITQYMVDWHYWWLNYIMPYVYRNEIIIDNDIDTVYKDRVISGFYAETQIQLINGSTVSIEDVEIGDIVASYDMRNDEIIPAEVTNVICYDSGEVTDDLILINNDFQAIANQSLYVNYWWVSAEDVQVGDELMCYSEGEPQMITVNDVESGTPAFAPCYALELDSSLGVLASYFVDGILVCV